jgi:glucose/arabinose dehydrogenase
MILRIVAMSVALIAIALEVPARAQKGPLEDPIPKPIPQSHIRVNLKPVATGLTAPVYLTVIPGDNNRMFVVDQTGLIVIVKNGVVQTTPFLDITGVLAQLPPAFPGAPQGVNPGYDERGLLGLAFHPGYSDASSAGFRTLYTLHNVPITKRADFEEPPFPNANVVPNCQEVIAEWKVSQANPDAVDPNSYREILRYDKPQFNHNGGTIAFGPDNLLYGAFGDGGNANDVGDGHNPTTGNAQDLTTILGKMIRINPLNPNLTTDQDGTLSSNGQYRIPKTNPFLATPGALGEIYAYGFRNPYRFSFEAGSGRLIVGDVGQNNIEEVDIVTSGGNYGWNIQEGTFLFDPTTGDVFKNPKGNPNLIDPVVEYDHFEATTGNAAARQAVVGGFVYHGSTVFGLGGKYVCADLEGVLLAADLKTGKLERLIPDVEFFVKGFGQDNANELYVLGSTDLGPTGAHGMVLQITPLGRGGH